MEASGKTLRYLRKPFCQQKINYCWWPTRYRRPQTPTPEIKTLRAFFLTNGTAQHHSTLSSPLTALKHCNSDNAFNRNGSSVFSGRAIETAAVLGPPTQFSLFRRLELFASQKHNVEGTRAINHPTELEHSAEWLAHASDSDVWWRSKANTGCRHVLREPVILERIVSCLIMQSF